MDTPEEVFDWAVRRREIAAGALDLASVDDAELRTTLNHFRTGFAAALLADGAHANTRGVRLAYHFDFVDVESIRAFAFREDGISCIGISKGLVRGATLYCVAVQLSQRMPSIIGVSEQARDNIASAMLQFLLGFVVCHEYAHHFWCDIGPESKVELLEEFATDASGGLDSQIREVRADGYALHLVLENLMDGPLRSALIARLGIEDFNWQNRVLLSLAIVGISGFFLLNAGGERVPLTEEAIRSRSHPPVATRLICIMEEMQIWANVNSSFDVSGWVNRYNFQRLRARFSEPDPWKDEIEFMQTTAWRTYWTDLISGVNRLRTQRRAEP